MYGKGYGTTNMYGNANGTTNMYGNAYGTRYTVTLVVTLSLMATLVTYVWVQILVGATIMLAETFRGFARLLQANNKTVPAAPPTVSALHYSPSFII